MRTKTRGNAQDNLLVEVQFVQIDGVEPALCSGASGQKERIDVGDVAGGIYNDGTEQGRGYDVGVMQQDKVEMELVQQWNARFDGIRAPDSGREHGERVATKSYLVLGPRRPGLGWGEITKEEWKSFRS